MADRRADGCPEPYVACYRRDAAIAFGAWVAKLESWARDAWIYCGPSPAEESGQ